MTLLVVALYRDVMAGLVSCGSCGCPVKRVEKDCPFCGSPMHRAGRTGGSRSAAAAAMGLATAVTVGVGTGACGSKVTIEGSGGAGGNGGPSSVSSSMDVSSTMTTMMSTTFVAAYGPPPSFCEPSVATINALSGLGDFCFNCAEFSCCDQMEACGDDCAACLGGDVMCTTPGGEAQSQALRECLGNSCGPDCGLAEICDSGIQAPNLDCAECASDNCCVEFTTCAQDPNCLDCLGGNMNACDLTMSEEALITCVETQCPIACL